MLAVAEIIKCQHIYAQFVKMSLLVKIRSLSESGNKNKTKKKDDIVVGNRRQAGFPESNNKDRSETSSVERGRRAGNKMLEGLA